MQIDIRPYQPDHLEAIVALSLQAWEPVFVSVKQHSDPEFQRRGISSRLVVFATQKMQEAQMEICMIGTGADPGYGPARGSYEKSGFKPWHNVIYFKKLESSDAGTS